MSFVAEVSHIIALCINLPSVSDVCLSFQHACGSVKTHAQLVRGKRMGWGYTMLRALVVVMVVSGLAPVGAYAFQQTDVLPKAAVSAEPEASTSLSDVPLALEAPDEDEEAASGPIISFPGIGKIGTLPKFDFGLELLYGEDESATAVEDDAADGSISIRGSVKHKF